MNKYQALIKVAELGSISKAAAALGKSQPGVSYILNSFEEELGFRLFERNSSGMVLTEFGEKVLKYSKEILAGENKIEQAVLSRNQMSAGMIKIGSFVSALVSFMPEALRQFSKEYPNVGIYIEEYQGEDVLEDLKNGVIDVAFIASHVDSIDIRDVPEGYICEPLIQDRMCLVLNEANPLAAYDRISFEQLRDCNLIVPSITWNDVLKINLKDSDFTPQYKYIVRSDVSLFSMVSKNLGVAFVSSLEEPIHFDNITLRDFEEDTSRTLVAMSSAYSNSTAAVRALVNICRKVIKSGNW